MTFRELLEKYKEGTLTEDEKLLVEKELEKSEAINDYLAEDIELSLKQDNEGNYEIPNDDLKFEKSIRSSVNRKLAYVIAISAASVFVILFIVQYIISPLVASRYYNPTKKSAGLKYFEDLSFDLRAITEVSMPGYAMSFIADAEDMGFGKYNIIFTRKNLFTKEKENVYVKIDKNMRVGNFKDFYTRDYFAFSEFWNAEEGNGEYQKALEIQKHLSEEEIEHISELPGTSYISAWVRFSEDLTMEKLYEVKKVYNDIDFKWIAVRTAQKQGQQLMGFSTDPNAGFVSSETVDEEKYPGFQLTDIFRLLGTTEPTEPEVQMAEIYETHFTSLLKYLQDHQKAVTVLMGYSKAYDYRSALNYVEEYGMSTYGALIYGEADDLIELYKSDIIMTLDIDDVITSKYIQ